MMPIKEFLNKLKWDPRFKDKHYIIYFYDRVEDCLQHVHFENITIEDNFIKTKLSDIEVTIPLHRVREVRDEEKLIWKRPS